MHLPLFLTLSLVLAAPPAGYQPQVKVSSPTRLDWTFAVSDRSLLQPPAKWLGDYDSKVQTFELFVPPARTARPPLPLILFISPGNNPGGWKAFEGACKKLGFAFAGVRDAGNEVSPQRRVRIALDVLDEVRRQVAIDPDRTYVAGFSGGGRIACAIGFALPELFGGILPIAASGDIREESWLQRRAIDRLSVALLTGENDFNRGEVERLRTPFLKAVGIRARSWTQPKLGHGIPNEETLVEALRWLDEGAARRREFAKTYPASHVLGNPPIREQQAQALLAEGKERLKQKQTLHSGLMLIQGVMKRWPDLDTAQQAEKLLLEYEKRPDKPWEADDIAEQRKVLVARAQGLDAYASGDLPEQYRKNRPEMLRQAIQLWQQIQQDSPNSAAGKEAAQRIPILEKLGPSADK